jgi:hypothetical protein
MVVVEHVLLALKALVEWAVPDVPQEVPADALWSIRYALPRAIKHHEALQRVTTHH